MKKFNKGFLLIPFVALLGLIGTSGAYFSTLAHSTNNLLTTGNMKVVLSDDNETQKSEISGTWNFTNLMPGAQLPQTKFEVYNISSINAHHIDIQFSYTGSEDLAKNIIFNTVNNGFRYGGSGDGSSVNLQTALRGYSDTDYIVKQGLNGLPFEVGTVDGIDGSPRDSKISLYELVTFGKIRIEKGEEEGGIVAGKAADLWLNAQVSPDVTIQDGSINMIVTVTLDQDASQM
jgi:hypothetical protein